MVFIAGVTLFILGGITQNTNTFLSSIACLLAAIWLLLLGNSPDRETPNRNN